MFGVGFCQSLVYEINSDELHGIGLELVYGIVK